MNEHKNDVRINELLVSIGSTKRHLATLEAEIGRLKNERAADQCKFKRGDRVMYFKKPYEVSRVFASRSFGSPEIWAWNILKSGQVGNRETHLYQQEQIQRIEQNCTTVSI